MLDDWKEQIISKDPKKGDLSGCNNWRGITLLSVLSKGFTTLLLNRMQEPVLRN
jgi:hypothetical protein